MKSNKDIEYRCGDIVLMRATIKTISQSEGGFPVYGVALFSGISATVSQQHIAGITTDVPNDKVEEE